MGVCEQPHRGGADLIPALQLSRRRGVEEPVRRSAPPEEVAQAGRDLECREAEGARHTRRPACLARSGRGTPGPGASPGPRGPRAILKSFFSTANDCSEAYSVDLGVGEWTTQRAPPEGGDELLEAGRVARSGGGAGQHASAVAGGSAISRCATSVATCSAASDQGLRGELGEVVVVERVVRVLGEQREPFPGGVPHQVPDGVVVLVPGETVGPGRAHLQGSRRGRGAARAPPGETIFPSQPTSRVSVRPTQRRVEAQPHSAGRTSKSGPAGFRGVFPGAGGPARARNRCGAPPDSGGGQTTPHAASGIDDHRPGHVLVPVAAEHVAGEREAAGLLRGDLHPVVPPAGTSVRMPSSGSLNPCFRSSEVSSSTTCSPRLTWISAGENSNFFAVTLMTRGSSAASRGHRQHERQTSENGDRPLFTPAPPSRRTPRG